MVWVKGPNYGGPTTAGATHGSSSGSTSTRTSRGAGVVSSRGQGNQSNSSLPNRNRITNPLPDPVQTGTWGQGDPNDEKSDFIDYDYVSKTTGKTVGQMQADAKKEDLTRMGQRADDMNIAMEMANKARSKETGQVNLNALSDQDLEIMRDAGLFAGEAEGVLGGVAGIEQVTNQSKQELINIRREIGKKIDEETGGKLSDAEWSKRVSEELNKDKRAQQLGVLFGGSDNALRSTYGTKDTPGVGFDPTGMLSWSDVESDPNLKYAYYGLTGDPSADQLRQHLPTYEPLGYTALGGTSSDGQNDQSGYYGWPGGGGSEGGSGYGYGYSGDDGPLARGYQRAKFGPGTLQEQVNQNFMRLSGLQKKRGGIVSLLELR